MGWEMWLFQVVAPVCPFAVTCTLACTLVGFADGPDFCFFGAVPSMAGAGIFLFYAPLPRLLTFSVKWSCS